MEQPGTYGIVVVQADVSPTIVSAAGTCALSLQPTIPFEPLAGFVPTPDTYDVNAIACLQNVEGC